MRTARNLREQTRFEDYLRQSKANSPPCADSHRPPATLARRMAGFGKPSTPVLRPRWVIHVGFAESLICPVRGHFRTCRFAVEGIGPDVIQAPKLEPRIMRNELSDYEWTAIKPMLPNKPRGVPRVNDRRVLNGIFWVLRSGAPWRDLPESYGPPTTCYNRFVRWRRAGVWDRIMEALATAHDKAVQMDRYINCASAPARSLHCREQRTAYGSFARRTDQQGTRRCGR
jgi:transposase